MREQSSRSASGRRSDWVLATKHSGEGSLARDGAPITSKTIRETLEGSLKRLKTDYIDLYQFHWPNRGSYMFRKNWHFDPTGQDRTAVIADIEECLGALQREVERGTIRAFGLSNESAWGTVQWIEAAKRLGGPRVATLQNEYSLMCRLADTDVAEMCWNEDVGFLPFSPLACGYLTGKYSGGTVPEASRMTLNPDMGGRQGDRALAVTLALLRSDLDRAAPILFHAPDGPPQSALFFDGAVLALTTLRRWPGMRSGSFRVSKATYLALPVGPSRLMTSARGMPTQGTTMDQASTQRSR